jgi:cupin fold WbuC family metalloprotein
MGSELEASVDQVQQVGSAEITALFREAELSPRKRAHLLLHRDHTDPVQRLMIACCLGTYFRPHCHPEQWELMSLLEGNADVITFNADGSVVRRRSMRLTPVVQIAQNVLHTIIITAPRTLLLEVKPGPFRQAEFPPWAPEENSQGTVHLLEQLKRPHTGLSDN